MVFLFARQGMESELNHNPDSVQKIIHPLLSVSICINLW